MGRVLSAWAGGFVISAVLRAAGVDSGLAFVIAVMAAAAIWLVLGLEPRRRPAPRPYRQAPRRNRAPAMNVPARQAETAGEGAAERLLSLVLGSGAHLWHNRPGVAIDGRWYPATQRRRGRGEPVAPGLFVPAAERLYGQLLEIYALDRTLMAHFASYALLETEWRDLKVCCAALMLVQPQAGQPVRDDQGAVAFYEDDHRAIGEAMILWYQQGSNRMMTPKMVLRVGQLLELPEIAALNRQTGFADPASAKPPLGRWPKAARQWLRQREDNPYLLNGLVAAGYKETVKRLARKVGYKPRSQRFFEALGWGQKQAVAGHRQVGLGDLELAEAGTLRRPRRGADLERITAEGLGYKETVGRLPAGTELTPAIMAALLPSLSDRDLRIMTPTLESLGLLADPEIRARWQAAVQTATDQRALNVARNVQSQELRETLETAADAAARAAVAEAAGDEEIHVMFLIDTLGIDAGRDRGLEGGAGAHPSGVPTRAPAYRCLQYCCRVADAKGAEPGGGRAHAAADPGRGRHHVLVVPRRVQASRRHDSGRSQADPDRRW